MIRKVRFTCNEIGILLNVNFYFNSFVIFWRSIVSGTVKICITRANVWFTVLLRT